MKGDRKDFEFVKTSLAAKGFDVVYDINGMQCLISTSFLCFTAMNSGKMFCSLLLIPIYLFEMFLGREAVEVEPILDALPKLEQ